MLSENILTDTSASHSLLNSQPAGDTADDVLMARLSSGHTESLGILYDRYGGLGYGLAYRMLGDATAAADVVQEAFLAVWRTAHSYDPTKGTVRTWFMTAVRNRCIDILRGPRRQVELDDVMAETLSLTGTDDVWESVSKTIDAQTVQQALGRLPEDQRTTMTLAYFGGLTHAQIASQMRVPLGTVKGRMRLAMDKLRDMLTNTGDMKPVA